MQRTCVTEEGRPDCFEYLIEYPWIRSQRSATTCGLTHAPSANATAATTTSTTTNRATEHFLGWGPGAESNRAHHGGACRQGVAQASSIGPEKGLVVEPMEDGVEPTSK